MASRQEQYQKLVQQIRDWNASRLDLFEISLPNEVCMTLPSLCQIHRLTFVLNKFVIVQ